MSLKRACISAFTPELYTIKHNTMEIIGKEYLVDFGMAKAVLHFESETSLTFTITEKEGTEDNTTETVAVKLTEVRPQVLMATWQEASGTTVTQVQDYEKSIIYSNWTQTGGQFYNAQGTIKPV
jgi:hypothetical protein